VGKHKYFRTPSFKRNNIGLSIHYEQMPTVFHKKVQPRNMQLFRTLYICTYSVKLSAHVKNAFCV